MTALDKLPEEAQQELARLLQVLSRRESPPCAAKALLALGGSFDSKDLQEMEKAIEEGCEQVDVNGW